MSRVYNKYLFNKFKQILNHRFIMIFYYNNLNTWQATSEKLLSSSNINFLEHNNIQYKFVKNRIVKAVLLSKFSGLVDSQIMYNDKNSIKDSFEQPPYTAFSKVFNGPILIFYSNSGILGYKDLLVNLKQLVKDKSLVFLGAKIDNSFLKPSDLERFKSIRTLKDSQVALVSMCQLFGYRLIHCLQQKIDKK